MDARRENSLWSETPPTYLASNCSFNVSRLIVYPVVSRLIVQLFVQSSTVSRPTSHLKSPHNPLRLCVSAGKTNNTQKHPCLIVRSTSHVYCLPSCLTSQVVQPSTSSRPTSHLKSPHNPLCLCVPAGNKKAPQHPCLFVHTRVKTRKFILCGIFLVMHW